MEQRGQLFTAILCRAAGEAEPELDQITDMAFSFIASQLDRDREKWESIREKRIEAGKKGGQISSRSKDKQNKQVLSLLNKDKQNQANQAVNVNVNGNVNVIPPISPTGDEADQMQESMELPGESLMGEIAGGADEESVYHFTTPTEQLFNRFWSAYPRKASKPNASKAFKKLNVTEPLLADMLAALGWQRTLEDWTKEGGKFIPHPATWLNGRRWEDEPPPGHRPAQSASTAEPAPRYETVFENGKRVAKLVQ